MKRGGNGERDERERQENTSSSSWPAAPTKESDVTEKDDMQDYNDNGPVITILSPMSCSPLHDPHTYSHSGWSNGSSTKRILMRHE